MLPSVIHPSLAFLLVEFESLINQKHESNYETQLGKLLYQVPDTMSLNCSSKCLIRVAIDVKSIRKGIFSGIKARIKNRIALSERMSAELIDPSGTVFSIIALNAKVQKILSKGFTEWIFQVIPLEIGIHELLVKVSLLEFDQNVKEYVPRDISMLESVTIIAVDSQNDQSLPKNQNSWSHLDIFSKQAPYEWPHKRTYPSYEEAAGIPVSYGTPNAKKGEMTNPLPETPSSLIGYILNLFPKPLNVIVALCLLGGAAYVAYNYFMPKNSDNIENLTAKVYVSGRLYIDNGAPRINEVTRLVLRNMPEVNSTRLDATGKYTFQNVSIPENKKLLVEITFENGQTVPTEELSVGMVDPNDNTLYLDDINASRPKPARAGKSATGWSIKSINQNNLNGDNNANQK